MISLLAPFSFNLTVSATQIPSWQFLIIMIIAFAITIIFGIFSLLMLLDCLKRDFDGQSKWVMIILFFNIIGALAYYFNVKNIKV